MNHRWIEERLPLMTVCTVVMILIGTITELVPLFFVQSVVPKIEEVKPYHPLELEGRDIYIREGCYNCHSQAVRPFRDETERYGPYSKPGEYVFDRPFQWGSKRTGPDLHRVGGKYPDSWHYLHMVDPRSMVTESIMPGYPWLASQKLDKSLTQKKMEVLVQLGTPYTEREIERADKRMEILANRIAQRLKKDGIENVDPESELIAMIAYLQRLGSDINWRDQ